MLICWLIGHRYDYEFKYDCCRALVCTRCGRMRILSDVRVERRAVTGDLNILVEKEAPLTERSLSDKINRVGSRIFQSKPERRSL